nr:bet1-like SNARE 1-1 [Ipomoea batatas]
MIASSFLPIRRHHRRCAATASAPALNVHCRVQADLSSPDDILPVPSSPPSAGDCKARTALFDGIEEGGIRASLSYSSHEIDEHENEKALEGLQDRVNLLKRLRCWMVKKENEIDRMKKENDSMQIELSLLTVPAAGRSLEQSQHFNSVANVSFLFAHSFT